MYFSCYYFSPCQACILCFRLYVWKNTTCWVSSFKNWIDFEFIQLNILKNTETTNHKETICEGENQKASTPLRLRWNKNAGYLIVFSFFFLLGFCFLFLFSFVVSFEKTNKQTNERTNKQPKQNKTNNTNNWLKLPISVHSPLVKTLIRYISSDPLNFLLEILQKVLLWINNKKQESIR